jgi:hypothetical protein
MIRIPSPYLNQSKKGGIVYYFKLNDMFQTFSLASRLHFFGGGRGLTKQKKGGGEGGKRSFNDTLERKFSLVYWHRFVQYCFVYVRIINRENFRTLAARMTAGLMSV